MIHKSYISHSNESEILEIITDVFIFNKEIDIGLSNTTNLYFDYNTIQATISYIKEQLQYYNLIFSAIALAN